MATKIPSAKWRPIARNFTNRRRIRTRGVILHTTASKKATSMFGWFSNVAARASSNLHIADDGTIEQYVDLDKIAWTTGAASDTTIGIETQGDGTDPWTDAQLDALEDTLVHICRRYGIPARQMTSSRASEQGIGWHRLGVDGHFPATGILRGRNQRGGGESWSSSRGKVCPGDARIKQIPALVDAVADRLALTGDQLDTDGVLGPLSYAEWQRQLGTHPDGKVSTPESQMVYELERTLNAKNGHGGFTLTAGPLGLDGGLDHRDWVAVQKLLNVWIARKAITANRPLELTGRPDRRTSIVLQRSLNAELWK